MAEFEIRCDVQYALTYADINSANQLDTLAFGSPPGLSSTPCPTKSTVTGEPGLDSLYVGSRVVVEDSWALDALPSLLQQPPAGTPLNPETKVSVFYRGIFPLISRCAYKLLVTLATPTDSSGGDLGIKNAPADGRMIVFDEPNFRGSYRIIDRSEGDLSTSHGGFLNQNALGGIPGRANERFPGFLNDSISSFVVVRGKWRLFKHRAFQQAFANTKDPRNGLFGPGLYGDVVTCGVENDQVSSMLCVGL